MLDGFDKLAEGAGKALETIPELYDDALKPAAQESGKLLARVPRAINAVFADLDKWILNKEYSTEETKKLLSHKLQSISPEKIVTPEPYVAIPAIQAISYSMNSEELRNLYANLLAKSMNTDTKDSVHPAFVEIIKQMSPTDAKVFKIICKAETRPLISISILDENGGLTSVQRHFSWINSIPASIICTSLDNLVRLGLIDIPYGSSYSNTYFYNKIKKSLKFKAFTEALKEKLEKGQSLYLSEEVIQLNDLSTLFYSVCLSDS
ncbi:DUF4393 domain-containing protein [Lacrimispora sp.]|uniref:DUF4393 domain-containing protein n=1 Tax=Lacrimispora sp. TaxID=2719234 RepID=UPI003991C1D2